jgi:pimeloyl-ACP methyl ester carboxylesterase
MGASLCLQLAAAHPDCAAKIILIDPTCLAARIGPEGILSLILGFLLPTISIILASLAVPFYTMRGALFSLGLSIPNVPSLLKGFLSLASRYPSFGYTKRHAKALRGVPVTVCTTRGWFFHSSVSGSEWGIDHAHHVQLEASSPIGAGLELDESVWCAEEWYSDGEDEAREMSVTLREVEAKADALQKLGRYDEVLTYLEQVSECLPSPATRRHVEVLWRLARAYHDVFWWKSEGKERSARQGLVTKGLATAFCALQTDGGCASAHLWYALLLSKVGEFEGTKAALVNSFEVREHLTRATQINPTSPGRLYPHRAAPQPQTLNP